MASDDEETTIPFEALMDSSPSGKTWLMEIKASDPMTEEMFIFALQATINEWKKDNAELMKSARTIN